MSISRFITFCLAVLLLSACHKDKGNYSYNDIPRLYVDTVGVQKSFEVYQAQGKVTITPKIVYDGNEADLKHLWRLYVSAGVFDTLARKKVVDTVVTRPPGTYTLEYEAMNPDGRKALTQFTVVVLSPIPSGWMVAFENAAGNTDVDVLRHPDFITGARDTILEKVYSKRNGSALPGKPVSVAYWSTALSHLYTTSTGVKVQNTDFGFVQNFKQLFLLGNPPETIKPEAFWLGSFNQGMLVNDGDVYWASEGNYIGKITVDAKGYQAAPFIYNHYAKQGGFYDQLNMRFVVIEQQTSQASVFPNAESTARFNLNNIGKKLLWIERGFGADASTGDVHKYAFFQDVTGNGRYLYVINTQAPTKPDLAAINISTAPDILDAKFYAVGNLGPAAFYGTASKVYNFQVSNASNAISTPAVVFEAPSGEAITCMKLLKNSGTFGVGAPTANDSKFMYIATWNAAANIAKVYMYAANITSGALGAAPVKVWTVGGKVGDMSYKQI